MGIIHSKRIATKECIADVSDTLALPDPVVHLSGDQHDPNDLDRLPQIVCNLSGRIADIHHPQGSAIAKKKRKIRGQTSYVCCELVLVDVDMRVNVRGAYACVSQYVRAEFVCNHLERANTPRHLFKQSCNVMKEKTNVIKTKSVALSTSPAWADPVGF